jgi:Mg-chelatase subunit ChlD
MRALPLLLTAALLVAGSERASSQTASVKAAESVPVGSPLEVRWTGPNAAGDFVSIDAAGAAESTYGAYAYPSAGNPLTLKAPDAPGTYEIRYHGGGAGYPVLARAPLRVTDVAATLEAPASVEAAGTLSVRWQGPNQPNDFVSIDRAGAGDREYGNYAYPSQGNPLSIRAPDAPGEYAVRYHLAGSYRVIGSAPLRVGAVGATLKPPASAVAGASVAIAWSGPGKTGDFVSIDAPGAPERDYGNYAYAAKENPVAVRAPDAPGDYVVRYHLAASYAVIGSAPLRVEPATATLAAPATVVAGSVFEVRWSGPNNTGDYVSVLKSGAPDRTWGASNGYTARGNPVRIEAPAVPGAYELRYLTGQSTLTLAKAPLRVTPGAARGKLRVVSESADAGSYPNVEFVLDASGSMLQRLGGVRRIELAKTALSELARDALPASSAFALRVFGHEQAGSCRTDLEIPLAKIDRAAAVARIQALGAMNLAKTPIAASLLKVKDDLAGASGPRLVVLVTDGEETCEGDPKAAIAALRAGGVDVRVDIVGFAVDEVVLEDTFREWARLGGGSYFDANDGEQLRKAMRDALQPSFEVLAGAKVVATGAVNGEAVALPVGSYRVRLRGSGKDLGAVAIEAEAVRDLRY